MTYPQHSAASSGLLILTVMNVVCILYRKVQFSSVVGQDLC